MEYTFQFDDINVKLSTEQKAKLLNSFEELHPYLESCYTLCQRCPKTNLTHISIVLNFKLNARVNLENLSTECKHKWKLNEMQSLFDLDIVQMLFKKKKGEIWLLDGKPFSGTPPLQRCLPADLIELMFGEEAKLYHLDALPDCFH